MTSITKTADQAVLNQVADQLKQTTGGQWLARFVRQDGVQCLNGDMIRFPTWGDDVKKIESEVTVITNKIAKLESEVVQIKDKKADWKEKNPVKSFLLTAARVTGLVLYWVPMFALFSTFVGMPIVLAFEGAHRHTKVSDKIRKGSKLANAEGKVKKNALKKRQLQSRIRAANTLKFSLNQSKESVLNQLKANLEVAKEAKDKGLANRADRIQEAIEHLNKLNFA